jgi:epoxyqueuosine reductase
VIPSGTVKRLSVAAGFDLVRVGRAEPLHVERARYLDWIRAGRQGEMAWITEERARRAADPRSIVPRARSVISVGLAYWAGQRPANALNTGRVARYAWGRDYHTAMGRALEGLSERLQAELGGEHRWYVDTGPTLDRALAARSGLGWVGKNTNLLTERFGSFVLLGEIITTLEIEPDNPINRSCGSCRLCIVACPTGALGPEYTIDSRKCISYLTIEHRGPIPHAFRKSIGDWVFGCDICQDVCPPTMAPHLSDEGERRQWIGQLRSYARHSQPARGDSARPAGPIPGHPLFADRVRPAIDLLWLLRMSHEEYVEAFRGTAIKRAKDWMLRRNAAVALGNVGTADAVQPMARAMREDEHPVVRGHAAWALGRLGKRHAIPRVSDVLEAALASEADHSVCAEISLALRSIAEMPARS